MRFRLFLVVSAILLSLGFLLPAVTANHFNASAHSIPTVTHTISVLLGEKESKVLITYYYDPLVIGRFIRTIDQNMNGAIEEAEQKEWQKNYLSKISFTLGDKLIPLQKTKLTIPEPDKIMNSGEPIVIEGILPTELDCTTSTQFRVRDENVFMAIQDDVYTFTVDPNGCIKVKTLKTEFNDAHYSIGNVSVATTVTQPKGQQRLGELTNLIKNNKDFKSILLWAVLLAFILGALHALTPGHGKTLVAAYLVGQHGTIRDALILALTTTLTHTFSIYLLGFISIFATHYFLPEKIIPALEGLSALSIFGLGIWLFTKRWQEFKHQHAEHDSHDHSHSHEHDHHHGPGEHEHSNSTDHVHTLSELSGKRVSLKSLISLGFSGGIVPCVDALAIMIIAINLNKVALGMFLIFIFSLGLAAVLVGLGIVLVTSKQLFEKYAPSQRITVYFPLVSALLIIAIGGYLLLKTMRIGI